mgnify:CR=1 FL=1
MGISFRVVGDAPRFLLENQQLLPRIGRKKDPETLRVKTIITIRYAAGCHFGHPFVWLCV